MATRRDAFSRPYRVSDYRMLISPAREGGFLVSVPGFGPLTQGETREEARAMGRDALKEMLAAYAQQERIPPRPR